MPRIFQKKCFSMTGDNSKALANILAFTLNLSFENFPGWTYYNKFFIGTKDGLIIVGGVKISPAKSSHYLIFYFKKKLVRLQLL